MERPLKVPSQPKSSRPPIDPYAEMISVHDAEARKRAEWCFTICMCPQGNDMGRLNGEAAAMVADQVTCMRTACGDLEVVDPTVLRRAEEAIVDAFADRMRELLNTATAWGRA